MSEEKNPLRSQIFRYFGYQRRKNNNPSMYIGLKKRLFPNEKE